MRMAKAVNWIGRGMMIFGVLGVLNMIRKGIVVGPGWYAGPLLATLLLGPGFAFWYFTKNKYQKK